jgi:hypothetical protein
MHPRRTTPRSRAHRPRLSRRGRNLDGSRVRSMASIPPSLFDYQSSAHPSSLIGSVDSAVLSRGPRSPDRSANLGSTPDARQRLSLVGKTSGGADRSPDAPTTSLDPHRTTRRPRPSRADPRSHVPLFLDAHRACKAALGMRYLFRCGIPPRKRARRRRYQHRRVVRVFKA